MNYFNITIVALFLIGCKISVPAEVNSENDYKFTLGDIEFAPEENVKDFFRKKVKFEQNLYGDTYFVIMQFKDVPNKNAQYDMRQEITLVESITDHTYIVSFSKKIKKRTIKKHNVRAILPLTDSMKLEKGLKELMKKQKTMKINVVVAKSIEKEDLNNALKNLGINQSTEMFKETTNKYMIEANEAQMMEIASWPNVIRVEVGGLR